MELDQAALERIWAQFKDLELGDERRGKRAAQIAMMMARMPGGTLPELLGSAVALEAAYRLANNDQVDLDDLLSGHVEQTIARAEEAREVLVLHDTTTMSFAHGAAEKLGYLPTGKAGFFIHLSLVVDATRHRRPCGVLHVEPVARTSKSGRGSRKKHVSGRETAGWKDRESERWGRGVQHCQEQLENCRVVHVMDREGDKYELYAQMGEQNQQFVVRMRGDRRVGAKRGTKSLLHVVRSKSIVVEREIHISRRTSSGVPRSAQEMPPRAARTASLVVKAASVQLMRPASLSSSHPKSLLLNAVYVREQNAPRGQKPVQWTLLTNQPVDTEQQIERVIDIYRYRWLVEELFKAIKTGCSYEQRRFESRHALLNILALTLPVAVELLWLRARATDDPQAPATEVLTSEQIQVLRHVVPRALSKKPSAAEVLLAIAALGGHLKRNGSPGWQVLYRGYQKLLDYTVGWTAHRDASPPKLRTGRRNL